MNDWDDPTKPHQLLITHWWLTKAQWTDIAYAIVGGAAAWLLYAIAIVIV